MKVGWMRPNERLTRAAWQLEKQTAILVSHALEHIGLELSVLDGYGTGGDGSGRSSGGSSSTERAATMRHDLTTGRQQILDDIDGVCQQVSDMDRMLRKVLGERVPRYIPERCDGQRYEGWLDPWTPHSRDERNGWSRPECRDVAGGSGLCVACESRCNRWREGKGLPPLNASGRTT